jgi:predicted PurR-regulated permease PerM
MATRTLRPPAEEDAGTFTREKLQVVVLLVATALVFTLCFVITAPFLPALTWALAIAVITWPVHRRIARTLKKPDLAAATSVVIITILLIGPVVLIGAQIVNQAVEGVQTFQQQIESGEWRSKAAANPQVAPVLHWIEQHVDVKGGAVGILNAVRSRLGEWVKGTAWTLVQFGVMLFALYFFFRDRRDVLGAVRSMIPLSNTEVDEVFARIASMIRAGIGQHPHVACAGHARRFDVLGSRHPGACPLGRGDVLHIARAQPGCAGSLDSGRGSARGAGPLG